LPDITAEIQRAQRALGGSWGEIRVGGGGTFTGPVTLEYGQNLVLGPGFYDYSLSAATLDGVEGYRPLTPGMIRCKGYNTVAGAGWNTVIREPNTWAVVIPYYAFGQAQPAYFNITVRDLQIRGTPGIPASSGGSAIFLGNCFNGLVEGCYLNSIHCIGITLGGGAGPSIAVPGSNQRVRNCTFLGGADDWNSGGVNLAVVNCRDWHVEGCIFRRGGGSGVIDLEPNDNRDRCENFSIRNCIIDTRRILDPQPESPEAYLDGPESYYPPQGVSPICLLVHGLVGEDHGWVGPGTIAGNIMVGGWLTPGNFHEQEAFSAAGLAMQGQTIHGLTIEGNTFYSGNGPAIQVEGLQTVVRGNRIYGWGSGTSISVAGRHGIIEDNQIFDHGWAPWSDVTPGAIREILQYPGWTDWNLVRNNYLGWSHRAPGATPRDVPPSVVLTAPNSSTGGKAERNMILPNDPDELIDPFA
jgi:hypothetical protein